jgi:hypothetical protein
LHEVREVLARHFNGAPISKQNLSAWRQGGFKPQKPKPTEQAQERAKNKAVSRASSLESQSKPVKAGQGSPANRDESLKSTEPPIVEYVAMETVIQTDPRPPFASQTHNPAEVLDEKALKT